jgi:hypothetical protein
MVMVSRTQACISAFLFCQGKTTGPGQIRWFFAETPLCRALCWF